MTDKIDDVSSWCWGIVVADGPAVCLSGCSVEGVPNLKGYVVNSGSQLMSLPVSGQWGIHPIMMLME